MQKADNGNSKSATTAQELSDDALERVTGGRDASPITIGIFREPTYHPAKIVVPD